MAKAKKTDLKVATDDQLSTQLTELKREQFNLRFQAATNQLEKPSRVRDGFSSWLVAAWKRRLNASRFSSPSCS